MFAADVAASLITVCTAVSLWALRRQGVDEIRVDDLFILHLKPEFCLYCDK